MINEKKKIMLKLGFHEIIDLQIGVKTLFIVV
jgi:hypothetical protein